MPPADVTREDQPNRPANASVPPPVTSGGQAPGTWGPSESPMHDDSNPAVHSSPIVPLNLPNNPHSLHYPAPEEPTWQAGNVLQHPQPAYDDLGARIVPPASHNSGKTPPDASSSMYHGLPRFPTAEQQQQLYHSGYSSQPVPELPRLDDQTWTDPRICGNPSPPQLAVASQPPVQPGGPSPSATRPPRFCERSGSSPISAEGIDGPTGRSLASATTTASFLGQPSVQAATPAFKPHSRPPYATAAVPVTGGKQTRIDTQPPTPSARIHVTARSDNNHTNPIGANPAVTTGSALAKSTVPQTMTTGPVKHTNPNRLRDHTPGCPLETEKSFSAAYSIGQVFSYLRAGNDPGHMRRRIRYEFDYSAGVKIVLLLDPCNEHSGCLGICDGHHIMELYDIMEILKDWRQSSIFSATPCTKVSSVARGNLEVQWLCANSICYFLASLNIDAYFSVS